MANKLMIGTALIAGVVGIAAGGLFGGVFQAQHRYVSDVTTTTTADGRISVKRSCTYPTGWKLSVNHGGLLLTHSRLLQLEPIGVGKNKLTAPSLETRAWRIL
ncbi:hypothetical protein [Acidihalobacter prosperus]|uniref:hypothetical protein n=1 Tax=Acidihalobacter prosperus TaxID=160660 RepID=UPI0011AB5F6B|nr:hypothetical protein [Acidihalobacter prosperus]